jgi:hypothetical protein
MRLTVWKQNFAKNQEAVLASAVWIESYWFEQTVRATSFGLLCRASVKAPHREIRDARWSFVDDLGFAAHVGLG